MEIFKEHFCINDYDIIGFDLDNTLARYRVQNMANLEYLTMARFLVEKKCYPGRHLYKPFEKAIDFLIRGLFLDIEKGNILNLEMSGKIVKCYHGIHPLSQEEVTAIYGPQCHWDVTDKYVQNPMSCWNGPLNNQIRALLDFFDISVSLTFARLITTIEECAEEGGYPAYTRAQVWRDICESLSYMFVYNHFGLDKGDYFPALKKSPELYYYRSNQKVLDWLRELHKKKLVVLISGSDIDFVSHTAHHTLGDNWAELFDLVVCFAKKPGFFSGEHRPFARRHFPSELIYETSDISSSQLTKGGVYAHGNWDGILDFARRETGIAEPRALYFGDNMIQDVVVPNKCAAIDVIAVVEELAGEDHPDKELIISKTWGPYQGTTELPSLWATWLKKYACLAIPTIETIADFSIDHVFVSDP